MLASPINEFLPFGATFILSEDCEEEFRKLQNAHTSDRMLNLDETAATILHLKTVGMAFWFWAVLLQNNDSFVKNMVVYAIISRTPAKRNHALTEQEGLGVVWEVQKISPYL